MQDSRAMNLDSGHLDAGIARVRFLSLDGDTTAFLPRWRAMLNAEEIQRADRFVFQPDRDTFIAAHALARAMLSEATGAAPASWQFVKGRHGKPEVAAHINGPAPMFNISHTNGLVACALTRTHPIGVDVEASDRVTKLDIAGRYFAPEETAQVRAASPEQGKQRFFRFWTLKEAFIKATGEGLNRPLDSFGFSLDPIRITFYPERDEHRRTGDPADWQFAQMRPAPNRMLALAVHRAGAPDLVLDIQAAQPETIAPA